MAWRGARVLVGMAGLLLVAGCGGGDSVTPDADGADGAADTAVPDADAQSDAEPDVASVGCGPTVEAPDEAWWREAVIYEVFVRSFRDADGDGDGDLAGLIEKLDHLNDGDPATDTDLGVTALWLMPVTEAASYHGYDTTDYRAIDPDYGTLDDFDALVAAAHARGLRVILDLVLNHTSSQHPWFDAADTRDWYLWEAEDPGWTKPTGLGGTAWHPRGGEWYYGAFASAMPDLNHGNADVFDEVVATSRFWLDRGVDGFRLDAVRFMVETGEGDGQADTPETHAWWKAYRAALGETHPDALLLGEAWTSRPRVVPYFGDGDELHMAFDFDLQQAIVRAVRDRAADPLRTALCGTVRDYPAVAQDAVFLSNHDQTRIANEARQDAATLRMAAAMLFTLPGTPLVYYGEELGLPNGNTPKDEDKRRPMRWDDTALAGFTDGPAAWLPPVTGEGVSSVAAQTGDPGSLLSLYRDLIRLRRTTPALATGRTETVPKASLSSPKAVAWLRSDGATTLLAVHSVDVDPTDPLTVDLAGLLLAPDAVAAVTTLHGAATATVDASTLTVTGLAAPASVILELVPGG